jgi:hypothetical protein
MIFVTALLIGFLGLGLFLAFRELFAFQPQPDWKDANKLREKLMSAIPAAPHSRTAGRRETIRFCFGLRREFRSAWQLCRFLAPIAGDPGYVGTLVWLKVRFSAIFGLSVFFAAISADRVCDQLTEELRELGAAMRASALSILLSAEVQGSAA